MAPVSGVGPGTGQVANGDPFGSTLLHDLLDIDDSLGDDYVEEKMDANGHTMRKEVHKGPGFTSVSVTGDMGALPLGNLLGELIG